MLPYRKEASLYKSPDMEQLLENLIQGNRFTPPGHCLKAFNGQFRDAVRTEWTEKETGFEVIFYKDNLEHIALYDADGTLVEYKMSLPPDFLPDAIKTGVRGRGEIMNAMLVNKGNGIEYEIIIRDKTLTRHLLLLTDLGKVIEERSL
jgi:hypothetical protein